MLQMNLCDRKVLTRLDIILKEQSCYVFCNYKTDLGLIEAFSHHFSPLFYSELDHFCLWNTTIFFNNMLFFLLMQSQLLELLKLPKVCKSIIKSIKVVHTDLCKNSPFLLHRRNKSYGFETTWGRVNNDRSLIFEWAFHLNDLPQSLLVIFLPTIESFHKLLCQ